MTTPLINRNPDLFADPTSFKPQRYIDDPQLERYNLAFSKGPYRCLGINLAYQELFLVLAAIFNRFELYDGTGKQLGPTLELFETTDEDVIMVADFALPGVRKGSQGVRVLVR